MVFGWSITDFLPNLFQGLPGRINDGLPSTLVADAGQIPVDCWAL